MTEAQRITLYAMPSEGLADVVLKLLAFTGEGADFSEDANNRGSDLLMEARAILGVSE